MPSSEFSCNFNSCTILFVVGKSQIVKHVKLSTFKNNLAFSTVWVRPSACLGLLMGISDHVYSTSTAGLFAQRKEFIE